MSVLAFSVLALQLSAAEPAVFPEQFHGIWDSGSEPCGQGFDDAQITIAADTIDFWETSGTPEQVLVVDENEVSIIFAMSGEGENWREQIRFVLDRNGRRMFSEFVPIDGEPYRRATWFYQRCSAGSEANRG